MQVEKLKASQIRIRWVRGGETVNVDSPLTAFALGVRGGGKSAFLEALAEHYLAGGHAVLDLFGASSGEGLAWLRSGWVREMKLPALVITGRREVSCSWPTKFYEDLELADFDRNRIIISATPMYSDKEEEFRAAGKILDLLFNRYGWSKFIYLLVRESSNLFYSRIKLRKDQLESKAEAVYLIREARHHGLAFGMDSQKNSSIDIDFRALLDYVVFKRQGIFSLPADYRWLYGFLDPMWLRNMKQSQFGIISRRGSIGVGLNDMPVWHKREREHLVQALGIELGPSSGL
jgi:hypothetical protein